MKDKTLCFYDSGMFIELAITLSKSFGRVLYFSDWVSEYPISQDDRIGDGVPGLERISDFFEVVYDADNKFNVDIYCFPSIYHGWLQIFLRDKLGKRVWGSGLGDELERWRLQANKAFAKLGLPRPTMIEIEGMKSLRAHLKTVEDKYIKVSEYRGSGETWHHENYELSEPILDEMAHELGKEQEVFKWLVEDPINDAIEVGTDIPNCIDGMFPTKTIQGVEDKDCAYACVVKDYADISPLITDFNKAVAPLLKKYKYRNFMSTEIRVGKDKVPYMIDFTARYPSPPGEIYLELISNLAEMIWYGAEGILIEPKFAAKYAIEVMINSEWAENKWQTINFPPEVRQWVKLRNLAIINGTYCVIPRYKDFANIGAVVSIGNTLEECEKKANDIADKIKGYGVVVKTASIERIKKTISKAEKLGIKFD